MINKDKIYTNIMDVLHASICSFWNEFGREPNKVFISRDVVGFIVAYNRDLLMHYAEKERISIMGMDLEVVCDKKGFIEVGYVVRNPVTVNLDYAGEGGAE